MDSSEKPVLKNNDRTFTFYEVRHPADWGRLAANLSQPAVRNFFYWGHGGPDQIGYRKDLSRSIDRKALEILLKNAADPLTGVNSHAFRFVFIDGCNTGDGDLPIGFGIPKGKYSLADFVQKRGIRPRAYLGWNTANIVGFAGKVFSEEHKKFIDNFWDIWPQTDSQGFPLSVADALARAAIGQSGEPFTELNKKVIIHGCRDVVFTE